MATLTTAVNASEIYLVVDALPTTDFIQIDDEIVEIEAEFATIYDRPTGDTIPNKLRVRRGQLGTTAASHSGGATLAAVYGAGGGAGGAGVTLDNTVDPPAEVTTLIAAGSTIAGAEGTLRGKDFYAQDTDPGVVGLGSVWKNTDDDTWWERNAADDGWDASFAPRTYVGGANAALVRPSAQTFGSGDATAGSTAQAEDGDAFAISTAESQTGNVDASSSAVAAGAGTAVALITAGTETGDASAGIQALRGVVEASLIVSVTTANGAVFQTVGLPTADPAMAGALWNDTGTLKVSAG